MKRKKILVIANAASMIAQFNMRNLNILQSLQYDIDVACNFVEGNTCTNEVINDLKNTLSQNNISFHQVDFPRGLARFSKLRNSFKQVQKLMKDNHYDVIFVQSTVAGIATRKYAKRYNTKVIYIAHGFQFYKGASLFRWATFFFLEKHLSRKTDMLILTNEDDYQLALHSFHPKNITFVPGVGVNIDSFKNIQSFNVSKEREKLGIKQNDYVLFSAGELSRRKNHQIIMEIVKEMNNPNIKYLICGIGPLQEEYSQFIKFNNLENNVFLLGYQKDLSLFYSISDLFILPSLNEGLPVCLLMSLATKTISICSDIRGNHELVRDPRYLFSPKNKESIKECINYVMNHPDENKQIVENNYINLMKYSSDNVDKMMKDIFQKYLD